MLVLAAAVLGSAACAGSPRTSVECPDCNSAELDYLEALVAGSWEEGDKLDAEGSKFFVELGYAACANQDSDATLEEATAPLVAAGLSAGTAGMVVTSASAFLCPE